MSKELPKRPNELDGITYEIKTPHIKDSVFVTINNKKTDRGIVPFELFINTKNLQHYSWLVGMSRTISAIFRREEDITFLIKELKQVHDPEGGYFADGKQIPSMVAHMAHIIEEHINRIGAICDNI